jgi:hypothetical protein
MKNLINAKIELYEDSNFLEWVIDILQDAGVNFGCGFFQLTEREQAVLVTEAVNWAAKSIDDWFYGLKSRMYQYALDQGALGWYNEDEEVYYLYTPRTGVACFHDPFGEMEWVHGKRFNIGHCYGWSGVYRQDQAFDLLVNPALLDEMAEATRPRNQY